MTLYKDKYTLKQRIEESQKVLRKYPDRIPVIVETHTKEIVLDKQKYLVPTDLTVGMFLFVLRKRINLRPEEGIFLFADNTLMNTGALMSTVYAKHRDESNFLTFSISKENTFGCIIPFS
jgi:GABA(A) receptor-associated protein